MAPHRPRYAGKAPTGGRHDHCPLHSCSCHHGCREPLLRLAKQGLSQISGRRVLSVIGHFVLSSISPMFRCLCWGQVLSKHLRLAVAAPSSISSSSCFVSILASSGSQRLETDAIPCAQAVIVPLLLGSRSRLLPVLHSRVAWPDVREE